MLPIHIKEKRFIYAFFPHQRINKHIEDGIPLKRYEQISIDWSIQFLIRENISSQTIEMNLFF